METEREPLVKLKAKETSETFVVKDDQISRFYAHLKKSIFAHIFEEFEYFAKAIIYSKSPDHVL